MIISLTGFMGCGKSSVGRALSKLLCCPFMDLDAEIETRSGRTIPEIFEADGEKEFRRIEKETLSEVLRGWRDGMPGQSLILALGGGAVMTPECEEMVHRDTVCVYLRTSVDELVARLSGESAGRPLLNTTPPTNHNTSLRAERGNLQSSALRTRILNLMRQRAETYERVAHLVIDTDGKTIGQVASEITTLLPAKR